MTLNRLLITSVVVQNRPVRDVAAQYGVSESWLFELLARYRADGEAVFEPRSRRPHSVPTTAPRPHPPNGERRAGHSAAFTAAYAHVTEATTRLGTADKLVIEDPAAAAGALWSFVHGHITLELANHFAEFPDPVRQVLAPMGVTFCVGLGADRASALVSHEIALRRAWHTSP